MDSLHASPLLNLVLQLLYLTQLPINTEKINYFSYSSIGVLGGSEGGLVGLLSAIQCLGIELSVLALGVAVLIKI